ncbi:helix-turn-helix transcriptional regulator [Salinispora oceanensis]|uniref:helix-turn-helix transcriptional regulator n=1 Tax=Salinispora oceanensis TaxID=1050199 RepID=UPI001CC47AC6|nr:helix-turn-helix transcriptional regulator [Salinispora oceanensis]
MKRALGRRLAAWRKTRGLIQDDVARLVNSTRSTVAGVERGEQVVDRVFWVQCESLLHAGGEQSPEVMTWVQWQEVVDLAESDGPARSAELPRAGPPGSRRVRGQPKARRGLAEVRRRQSAGSFRSGRQWTALR